jgi:hypothetical protein
VTIVFVFFLCGLALVLLVGYLGYVAAKRRREAFAAAAAQRGWRYTARDDSWAERFDGPPFGQGHRREALNILQGTHDGRSFVAFDYVYHTTETSTGANGQTTSHEESHPFSIVAISTGVVLPHLRVTPEGMFGRVIGRMTGRDIELESEQFNRAFTVHCEDRKFATDFLHPRMMEYLLTLPRMAWDLRNGTLMFASPGRHSVEEVGGMLTTIDGILDRVPDFVWSERGARSDPGAGGPAGAPTS